MVVTKILGITWFASVIAIPVLGQASVHDAEAQLSSGNVQQVLAIVILGLSAAFVWLARRREKDLQDEKNDWRKWMQSEHDRTDKVTDALQDNSNALQSCAESLKSSKAADYHLAEVIRQCRGNNFDSKQKEPS